MGDIQDEDAPQMYEQGEINQAHKVKNMAPEDLLSLREALDRAVANIGMPEAVAICFTEVYTDSGNKINITCRGTSGKNAIDELASTLSYVQSRYNMVTASHRPTAPTVPDNEVHYVPLVAGTDVQPQQSTTNITNLDIDVTGLTRERKRDGKGDFVRARGGMFTKYGVPAYDNVLPATLDINKMTYGVEVLPPVGMGKAKVQAEVDKDGKYSHAKVIQFS